MNEGMTTEIRAVLFDFGGVLAAEGFRNGFCALAEEQGLDPALVFDAARRAVHDSGYVTGHGSESEFWDLVRSRSGLQGGDETLRAEIMSRFELRPWLFEQVERLRRRGLVVAILSDQTDWLERLDERLGFYSLFDRVFNSYRLGKTKHEETLFDEVVASLGFAPSAVLFIDDKEEHVQRARSRGLFALHYQGREEIEEALQGLAGETDRRD